MNCAPVTIGATIVAYAFLINAAWSDGQTRIDRSSVANSGELELSGLIRPSKQAHLALRVPGILRDCPIEEGERVQAGQLLARLDSEAEEALVGISKLKAQDELAIRAAELEEALRREELKRQQDLSATNASSSWELRNADLAHQLAEVRSETTRFDQRVLAEEWRRNELLLEQRRLAAPFAGWIWKVLKHEGEAVAELEPIAVLVQLDPLWVELNVPAAQFGRIARGDTATVIVEHGTCEAEVISIDPLVDVGSSTFRVKLQLPNPDRRLVAGTIAQIRLRLADRPLRPGPAKERAASAVTASGTSVRRGAP